jgi:putative heme-binding domain-containing protein
LDSEFQRAPETILRDILFPHETITQGFQTLRLSMKQGADVIGILASESPTSVTLQFPGGESRTFLRNRIAKVHQDSVSLMPAQFGWTLEPSETAAIIAFLTQRSRDGSSESKP